MSTQKTWTPEEMSSINYVKCLAEKTIDGRDARLAELVQEKYLILREALNRGDFGELKRACRKCKNASIYSRFLGKNFGKGEVAKTC